MCRSYQRRFSWAAWPRVPPRIDAERSRCRRCRTSGALPIGRIVNPHSGECLDVAAGSTANGAKVRLWACNGTGAQQWQFNANGAGTQPNQVWKQK
ncbi:RICIN domain-containing protein [Streptomyces sp. NPDC058301]|uniref:RICIN domain-containing protein n=1 Tax=Streptomyces sp. NPDC058301 TaxID=3346436 RepID=UPI0036F017FA